MAAPRKHAPKDAAEVIERLAAQGHSLIGIAKHFRVVRSTVKRWLDEDEMLSEAFEVGRETERQALHALVVQSAASNKPANVNAFFILKSRHGYRENDAPNNNITVNNAVTPVMVVKDHGTDKEWAAKCAAQQRELMQGHSASAPQLQAPQSGYEPAEALVHPTASACIVEAPAAFQGAPQSIPVWRSGR
jgi:hypothetical protein